MFGKINWFGGYNYKRDEENEFGFINTKRGDVYFHKSVIDNYDKVCRLLSENQLVILECESSKKGLKACFVKVLTNVKNLDDSAIDELKDSGLKLSSTILLEIENRVFNRVHSWDGLLQKAEEWIRQKSETKNIYNALYSPIVRTAPHFEDPQDDQAYFSPRKTFSPTVLRELMSTAPLEDLVPFLERFGYILSDEDLNYGLQLYLDHSDHPKRKLCIQFFRRLDEDRLMWLAEDLTKFLKKSNYVSTYEETIELLHIFRSMSPLYHMTHKENLANILEHGLVSHNKAHKENLVRSDISLREAQSRRGHLHDQVPLYFNPRNTMLFRRKELEPEIVMIALNPLVLLTCWKLTSGNGASSSSALYQTDNAKLLKTFLQVLEWDTIMSEKWYDEDPNVMSRQRRIMCAEALAPEVVPIDMIEYIGYASAKSLETIQENCSNKRIMCLESQDLYFGYHKSEASSFDEIFSFSRSRLRR